MTLVLPLLLGLSVLVFFLGLGMSAGPSAVQTRLDIYGSRPRTLAELELEQPFTDRVVSPTIRGLANLINRLAPQRNLEEMRHKIDLAGNPNNWTAADLLGVRGMAAIITLLIIGIPLFLLATPILQLILITSASGILGFYLPIFWLNSKIRQRKHEIQKALPDALDLLTISVEAGLGFDAALVKVTEKWDNELSRAFSRVNAEIRLGKLRREALRDMTNRTDVPDVSNFIAAVIQADQLGVSLAKVLRIQSDQMRIKRRQRAEEQAAQAPVKMMFPLVFLIFPSIFIVLLGPAVLIFMKGGLLGGG